jgi:threonine dehydrogenase-like Zn-dependent dehydrogenase
MFAGYLYGPEDVRFIEQDPPGPPTGSDITVRVYSAGICGTDLHRWRGQISRPLPTSLGHEYSGVVEAIGPDVSRVAVGDPVAVHPYVFCGRCTHCRHGRLEYCTSIVHYPLGLSQYAQVHESTAHVVPESVSLEEGVLLEPLGACVHALDLAELRIGHNVVVLGGGPIGLMCAMLSKVSGAARTIVVEPSAYRRELALTLGADAAVGSGSDTLEALRAELGLASVDVVFDCVTNSTSLAAGVEILTSLGPKSRAEQWATGRKRYASRLVVVGNAPADDVWRLPEMDIIHYAALDIRGATMRGDVGERCLRMLASIDFAPLITHRFGRDTVDEAFRLLGGGDAGKILVSPWIE